jgi:hypothetical protein
MNENIVRTLYASMLQTALNLALPFAPLPHSTLNEKFSIQNGVVASSGVSPSLGYWAIGNGGSSFTQGTNGLTIPVPNQHVGTDGGLFNHIPFVLRLLTNDLNSGQQANYRLRTIVTINGLQYAAYYLKKIPLDGAVINANLVSIVDGVKTVTAFTPTTDNLNPTPPTLDPGVNLSSANYVQASCAIALTLDVDDVTEILNACTIIYGSANYAIISEIGLVSGVDKAVTSPGVGSSTINVTEVIEAQIMAYVNTLSPLVFLNNGVTFNLDVGASEPILSLSN